MLFEWLFLYFVRRLSGDDNAVVGLTLAIPSMEVGVDVRFVYDRLVVRGREVGAADIGDKAVFVDRRGHV